MKKIIILLVTMLLLTLFTYTAFSKYIGLANFRASLEESLAYTGYRLYQPLPHPPDPVKRTTYQYE